MVYRIYMLKAMDVNESGRAGGSDDDGGGGGARYGGGGGTGDGSGGGSAGGTRDRAGGGTGDGSGGGSAGGTRDRAGGGTGDGTDDGAVPGWWPYARDFPGWQVWRGVDRLYYAALRDAGPPVRVRGEDPVDLRDQIRAHLLSSAPLNPPPT